MTKFQVTILGCGSAMPTTLHSPPSQLVELDNKLFMIDCGEGTQLQMRKFKARMSKLHSVFISHLHGDHIFGLPGLITTLSLLGRTQDLNIYAHKEIDFLISPLITYMGRHMTFKLNVIPLNPYSHEVLLESDRIKISSFPLKHRIETNGFVMEEKGVYSKRFAYCSDTAYEPAIIPYIKGVDLLYHEATFAESELERAKETYHSTARQAAEIAKEAEVGKLVVGHYSSRYNELGTLLKEAVNVFPDTELASEGKVFEL